jgi:hypothetical protein
MGLFDFFGKKNKDSVIYKGGDGSSEKNAIIIITNSTLLGIPAEYEWLNKRFGEQEKDWSLLLRANGSRDDGKVFEFFDIKLADGTVYKIHFEISSFFGKY